MIEEELKNEAEVRRFLLGELSETERNTFEENFISDELFFEQVRVVEDDLIESYIRGTLSAVEQEKFERSFLTTERRRNRVEFTRTMLDKLTGQKEIAAVKKTETVAAVPSVWDSITNFFKVPSLAFGAAMAILLAAFGGWFMLRNSNTQEIVQQTTPIPTATTEVIQSNSNQFTPPNQNNAANLNLKSLAANETNASNAEQKKETTNKNSNVQKEETAVVNPVLALFAGTVRSEGKTKELNLPKNAGNVLLQLNLESTDYKIYRAEIVTADGETISQTNKLKVRNSKINFSVPAAKLQRGDYIIKLSALNSKNETESVADYTFRVNRK